MKKPVSRVQIELEEWGRQDDSLCWFDPFYGCKKLFILYANEIESQSMRHLVAGSDDEFCERIYQMTSKDSLDLS
jgi:hypothetical protein